MHHIFWVLLCSLVITLPAAAATELHRSPLLVSLSVNHGNWSSDSDSEGSQSLAFAQISYDSELWGVLVSGVFANVDYAAPFAEERFSLSTVGDANISTYYNYTTGDFTLQGGVDASAPTGKAGYSDTELETIFVDDVSSDLMLISTYGQGLTVIPHLLAIYKFSETFTGGLGVRYEFSGSYDPGFEADDDDYNPGDRLLLVANGVITVSESNLLVGTLTAGHSGVDQQNSEDVYRQGDTVSGELRYLHSWNEQLSTILSVTYSTQNANESLTEEALLGTELSNSNNNSFETYATASYRMSQAMTLQCLIGIKSVGANGYEEENALYDAGRQKAYVEPGIQWAISDTMYLTGSARYSIINDKADAFSEDDARYNLFNVDIGLVFQL